MAYVYVAKRPGVEEFLRKASEVFELVVFTASIPKYANSLLNKLDPNHLIKYRLFREHCVLINNGLVKDLSRLGRQLKDIIILDNSSISYMLQPFNAIPIKTWIDDREDKQLEELWPVLNLLSRVYDVRTYLKQIVKNNQIDCKALKVLGITENVANEPKTMLIGNWIVKREQPLTSRHIENKVVQLKDIHKLLHGQCPNKGINELDLSELHKVAERRYSQRNFLARKNSLKTFDNTKENSQFINNFVQRLIPGTARHKYQIYKSRGYGRKEL